MLKNLLISAYISCKTENGLSYKNLSELSGLAEIQLSNILNHSGRNVSIEKMEEGLNRMGFYIKNVEFEYLGGGNED